MKWTLNLKLRFTPFVTTEEVWTSFKEANTFKHILDKTILFLLILIAKSIKPQSTISQSEDPQSHGKYVESQGVGFGGSNRVMAP